MISNSNFRSKLIAYRTPHNSTYTPSVTPALTCCSLLRRLFVDVVQPRRHFGRGRSSQQQPPPRRLIPGQRRRVR